MTKGIIRTMHQDGGWKFEAELSWRNRIRRDAEMTRRSFDMLL